MRQSRDQTKAALLAEAEVMVGELLVWDEQTPAPTLTQLEDILLKLRQRLSVRAAEMILENQEAVQPVVKPCCPRCERQMRYKGQKGAMVESRLGTLHLERGYYHCPHCQVGLCPPE